ncbi:MAG: hypothetical protein ACJ0FU_00855 [Gammaproteobacteria bacterium]|tara:strand:- start:3747 stop:4463 length:717 start_codon:yes stop_codon:yes gene_type:complete
MKNMISKRIILFILLSPISLNGDEVADYKAEYLFETGDFSVTGIRELITDEENEIARITFNAKTKIVKLFFESSFVINKGSIISKKYIANVRALLIKRNQSIIYDNINQNIKSSGQNKWDINYADDIDILDPLNAQVQMRLNVKDMHESKEYNSFEIALQDIRNGNIEVNTYKFSRNDIYTFNEKNYESIVIKRVRDQDSRITEYHLVPELGYLIMEVLDTGAEATQTLKLQKILSLG